MIFHLPIHIVECQVNIIPYKPHNVYCAASLVENLAELRRRTSHHSPHQSINRSDDANGHSEQHRSRRSMDVITEEQLTSLTEQLCQVSS